MSCGVLLNVPDGFSKRSERFVHPQSIQDKKIMKSNTIVDTFFIEVWWIFLLFISGDFGFCHTIEKPFSQLPDEKLRSR
jgi:hypothetical protein